MQNYRNNMALPSNTNCFNLASHKAYLDSVVATQGITSSVVFDQEGGRWYLERKGVKDFTCKTMVGRFPYPAPFPAGFPTGRTPR